MKQVIRIDVSKMLMLLLWNNRLNQGYTKVVGTYKWPYEGRKYAQNVCTITLSKNLDRA